MYKHLYDCFTHWFHEGRGGVWFYSDPHFSDEEMKWLRQNYIGDQEQVDNINKCVGKYDTIVILGDIGDPTWLQKIKGYKVLVLGNHDRGASIYKPYADEIYEGMLTISDKILLSHEPLDDQYHLVVHGHDHSGWFEAKTEHWHINCCAELIGYKPVCLKDIVNSGILKLIPDIHRETIDNATKRSKEKENGK